MKALLLSAALALTQVAPPPQEPSQERAEQATQPSAPPKAPIAGMAGFRSRSRVVLGTEPERALLLETFYVFPERARWSLVPEGAAATQRQLFLRFGASYWSIAPGAAESQPLAPETIRPAATSEIHMELRRAAMLWPDGLSWDGEGSLRSARTALEAAPPFTAQPTPLVLLARLDDAGRPCEMSVGLDAPDGGMVDTPIALRDITWRQQGERWWPHTFTLVGFGETEWHETVESIDTAINALDSFFVPPDRRGELGARASTTPVLVVLPPSCQRRIPLRAGTDLPSALEQARHLAQQEGLRLHPLGLVLAEGLALELDASGATCAVLLRLAEPPETLPEGWERLPERQAVSAVWAGAGPLTSRSFARLRALLPPDARPQAAYLPIAPDGQGEEVRQLVLPYTREP